MTDDYFDDFEDEAYRADKNPYGNKGELDYEDWKRPIHKKALTGVLSTYKKQMNLTADDVIQKDYWDKINSLNEDIQKNFEAADRRQYTKEMVAKLRLGREMTSSFTPAGEEYGNYQKFDNTRNSVKEVNDRGELDYGQDLEDKKLRKFMKEVQYEGSRLEHDKMERVDEKEWLQDIMADETIKDSNVLQKFSQLYSKMEMQDEAHRMENDKHAAQDAFGAHDTVRTGRLSPQMKEKIYREYLAGTPVKELSLAYGILDARVKAIVYQKFLYWEEVYPRMGETHMRAAY